MALPVRTNKIDPIEMTVGTLSGSPVVRTPSTINERVRLARGGLNDLRKRRNSLGLDVGVPVVSAQLARGHKLATMLGVGSAPSRQPSSHRNLTACLIGSFLVLDLYLLNRARLLGNISWIFMMAMIVGSPTPPPSTIPPLTPPSPRS